MIDTLLALIGIGQAQSQRSAELLAKASSHLAVVEMVCLEVGVTLAYEMDRLGKRAKKAQVHREIVLAPLLELVQQKELLLKMVEDNRNFLHQKGVNAQVVDELERWAGTCQVIPKHIEYVVRQIDQALLETIGNER